MASENRALQAATVSLTPEAVKSEYASLPVRSIQGTDRRWVRRLSTSK